MIWRRPRSCLNLKIRWRRSKQLNRKIQRLPARPSWILNVIVTKSLSTNRRSITQSVILRYISGTAVPLTVPDGWQELEIFMLTKPPRPGLGSTKYRDRYSGVKRAGVWKCHSLPSVCDVKKEGSPQLCLLGVQFSKPGKVSQMCVCI
jgi:hypothetical protein